MQERPKESREFTRCHTAMDVEITSGDRLVTGATRDVSLKGLYVNGERSIPAGARCTITLFLGGRGSQARVEASGRIARVDSGGMAVAFEEVSLDGYEHLKQLVLLNAADPDQVADEIAQHVGLRKRA